MVDHVRKALPGVEVHLADMRDLSRWGAAEFDFIFASNNVFDAVSHADRLRILARPGAYCRQTGVGVFVAQPPLSHGSKAHASLIRATPSPRRAM